MDVIRQKWIDAAIKLAENKNEKILCPNCSNSFLLVLDVPIHEWKKIDRYLYCESCKKHEVMTGKFKDSDFYFSDDTDTL